MAKKRIRIGDSVETAAQEAVDVLEAGGVVIFPTETVYGIGVASGDAEALEKLRRLKGREADKPFQYLAADIGMARTIGAVFSTRAVKLANNYWPGPLTLVVPDGTGSSTLGIRVPESPFITEVCRLLGRPVVASSANPAGGHPPATADAADVFGDEIDLLVDGGQAVDGVPSTVVRCGTEEFEILRLGDIDAEAIDVAWNE